MNLIVLDKGCPNHPYTILLDTSEPFVTYHRKYNLIFHQVYRILLTWILPYFLEIGI